MLTRSLLAVGALVAITSSANAAVVAQWNFNTRSTAANVGVGSVVGVGTTFQPWAAGAATEGTSGNYGLRVNGFDSVTTRSGGRGVAFSASTAGFRQLALEFWQRNDASASQWAQLQYSTDGGKSFATTGLANAGRYQVTSTGGYQKIQFNLGAIAAIADNKKFQFRVMAIIPQGAKRFAANGRNAYQANASWYFDSVALTGTAIAPVIGPEINPGGLNNQAGNGSNGGNSQAAPAPGAAALLAMAGAFGLSTRRRRD
jgi:hypothetical protein